MAQPRRVIAWVRLFRCVSGIDSGGPKEISTRKPRRKKCFLSLSLVAGEGKPASSRRVCSATAQERECGMGTAGAENSRELDGVSGGYRAQLRVRHRPGVGSQAIHRSVLLRERLRERRAVYEVLMQNLVQLGVRNAELPAPDRNHASDGGGSERVSQLVPTYHSGRGHDHQAIRP